MSVGPCIPQGCWHCRSAPVSAIATPTFETSALIELPGHATADPSTLLAHRQPLHLVVLHPQPAPVLLTPHAASVAARMSASPSASTTATTASIGIVQRSHSWGQRGPSPPGPGSALMRGHSSSSSGSNAGTAASIAPNAAYFLTATSGQQSHQQGPIRPVTSVSATDLLRMSNKAGVVGTCNIDWRQALTKKGEVNCNNVQLTSQAHADCVGMISVDLEVGIWPLDTKTWQVIGMLSLDKLCTGRYSGLYVPDLWIRHISHECMNGVMEWIMTARSSKASLSAWSLLLRAMLCASNCMRPDLCICLHALNAALGSM